MVNLTGQTSSSHLKAHDEIHRFSIKSSHRNSDIDHDTTSPPTILHHRLGIKISMSTKINGFRSLSKAHNFQH